MNLRVAIVLLVALCVLFFMGIGVGATGDDAPSLDAAAWLDGIAERLPTSNVSSDALNAVQPLTCFDEQDDALVVLADSTCLLVLEPAQRQRVLKLTLVAGDSAEISITQPVNKKGGLLTSDADGKSFELDIFRQQSADDQINVRIVCRALNAASCRLLFP